MHFAAFAEVKESVENPRKYFENNVRPALTLLNVAVDAGISKFVFVVYLRSLWSAVG
jgi:UDP-glucose 4-epimerase